jgi:hexosaminidase
MSFFRGPFHAVTAWFHASVAVLCVCVALAAPVYSAGPIDELPLVPWPKSVTVEPGTLELTNAARVVAGDERLALLAKALSDEIFLTSGLRLNASQGESKPGDIVLDWRTVGADEHPGAYEVRLSDRATVEGDSYQAVAEGTATLIQAIRAVDGKILLPKLAIVDWPHFTYCGTLLDVARKPYSIETLKQCVTPAACARFAMWFCT